ncbi:hypothetical protein [Limnoglobus roseus]|uniref:Uncharacterized protein n=1 Tax=Limnoglobus roseus TaxID=2598579 RepID=A0A5C1AJJ2_9BACT|nr:hypothetical protein [Limnoglobus roseus]QEL17872.1 hypothetical protein PX52LOC_04883 [Limnoglobus roseus]
MPAEQPRPPWLHRIHRAVEQNWQHHGPGSHVSLTSGFDEDHRLWRLFAAPVHQEVYGGEEDGRTVWTPFTFAFTDLVRGGLFAVPGLVIEQMAVASHNQSEYGGPMLVLKGSCDGEKLVLCVRLDPVPSSETVEIIDTIHEVIRPPRRTDGAEDR